MKGLAARLKVGSGLVSGGVLKRARQIIGPEVGEGRGTREDSPDLQSVSVRPGHDLFAPLSDWVRSWNAHFGLDESDLAEAGSGRIRLFGQDSFDVGWPVHWTRDPLTHQTAPDIPSADIDVWNPKTVGSIRYTWELGRQQHLVALAVGYAVSGRSEYRESIGFQIQGWVEQCPKGVGVHWTSRTESAVRLLSWTLAHGIVSLRDGEMGLLGSIPGMEQAIYQHAAHLSETLAPGGDPDHALVTRLTALYVCTSVFDLGADGRAWRDEANRVLEKLLEDRLGRDGLWPERGLGAQRRLLESLALAYSVGRRFREPWIGNATRFLYATRTFLNTVRPRNGTLPNVGEAVQGSVCRFGVRALDDTVADLDQVVAAALGEPSTGRPLSEKAYWIGWLAWGLVPDMRCEPAAPEPRSGPMRMFRDAGHAVLHGDRVQVNVIAGRGPGENLSTEGDGDALSFTLAVDGIFWLVDPGSYCLNERPDWRSYFRSTAAHNTVTVDYRSQGQGAGLIQRRRNFVAEFSDAGDTDRNAFVQAEHSGYDHLGVHHVRRVQLELDGSSLFLLDEFFGKGEHRLESAFHLAPDVEPKLEAGGSRVTLRRPGSRTSLALDVSKGWSLVLVKGQQDPKLGWYSSQPGLKQAAYCVVAKYKGRLPLRARTLIEISLGNT